MAASEPAARIDVAGAVARDSVGVLVGISILKFMGKNVGGIRAKRTPGWRIPLLAASALIAGFIAGLGGGVAGAAESLPSPTELSEDVLFWERVYGRVESNGGLLHDDRRLAVVYAQVLFESKDHEARVLQVEAQRSRLQQALQNLADHELSPQTDVERQVLEAWGASATVEGIREAASHIRFQLGQADHLRVGFGRAYSWKKILQAQLAANDVPVELWVLPLMESSFNFNALSKRKAAGIWQLMPEAVSRQLRIDDWVDERYDPVSATRAAAQMLAHNQKVLGSWPLAVMAYNHGLNGILRAKQTLNTDSVATLVRQYQGSSFGFASRNYYAEFLAVRDIAAHPQDYGIPVPRFVDPPLMRGLTTQPMSVKRLSQLTGLSVEDLKRLNPALRAAVYQDRARIPAHVPLNVPRSAVTAALGLQNIESLTAPSPSAVPATESSSEYATESSAAAAENARGKRYVATATDTPASVAARFNLTVAQLLALNHLALGDTLHLGQVLVVSP